MRFLDTPLRLAAGRTLRELVLIGTGLGAVVVAVESGDTSWNVWSYAVVTTLFALRFFAARVIYLGMCVAALGLQLSSALHPDVAIVDLAPVLAFIAGHIALLASRDLAVRFDDAASGNLGPFRNFWLDFPRRDRRHLALIGYGIATTGSMIHHAWVSASAWNAPVPTWMYVLVGAAIAAEVLLIAGRSLAAIAAVGLGVAVAVQVGPMAGALRHAVAGEALTRPLDYSYVVGAHYLLGALLAGVVTAVIASPYLLRWLRLAVR